MQSPSLLPPAQKSSAISRKDGPGRGDLVRARALVEALRATGLPLVLDDVAPPAEAGRLEAGLPALARATFRRQRAAAGLLVAPSGRIRDRLTEAPGPPPVPARRAPGLPRQGASPDPPPCTRGSTFPAPDR